MRKIIQAGESLRLYLTYDDIETGAALDPSALTCSVRQPDDTLVPIEYPSADFVREGPGAYFLRVRTTMPGTHAYRVIADFPAGDTDIREGKFDVEDPVEWT